MTNKEAIEWLSLEIEIWEAEYKAMHPTKEALRMAIDVLEKQELLEAMKSEEEVVEYLSTTSKDALIELFLQMRFERDLYMELYERREEE